MKAVIVFVVVGALVRASSVMTGCGLVVVSLQTVLTCMVKWGKCMRPCVVVPHCCSSKNATQLLALLVSSLRQSAKELSPISNFSVAVDIGFSNWPLATCIWKLDGSSILRMLFGALCWMVSKSSWAIALTNAPESTRASTVRLFSKFRGT